MIRLTPFAPSTNSSLFEISAEVTSPNSEDCLYFVRFVMKGDLEQIHWPQNPSSGRHHELWKTTCFELFLAPTPEPSEYFEVNVSPAGAWNCYHFSSYRENMMDSSHFTVQDIRLQEKTIHEKELTFSLRSSAPQVAALLHPTCVIETTEGNIQYWAHRHGVKPDFHAQALWPPASALR